MPSTSKDRIVCLSHWLPQTLDIPSQETLEWRPATPPRQHRASLPVDHSESS